MSPPCYDEHDRLSIEVDLIESAIQLVASGAATRSIVAGLSLAEAALPIAARRARDMAIELGAVPRIGGAGLDVVVSRRPTLVSLSTAEERAGPWGRSGHGA